MQTSTQNVKQAKEDFTRVLECFAYYAEGKPDLSAVVADELTMDVVWARAYTTGEAGDSDGWRMAFSVRYGDAIVEVHTKGVNPEWVYHQLKNLITEWLIQSAASDWELRFSFGDFDFLRYNEKKVVRLEHHFLSYRVKGPLEHRKEVLPWKIAEL